MNLPHEDRRQPALLSACRQNQRRAPRGGILPYPLGRRLSQDIIVILLAACVAAVTACAPKAGGEAEEDGITTPFPGDWRSCYERGLYFAGVGRQAEAVADFRRAIEGRGQDQWRIETSDGGLIDYFPHRELGILHFRSREFDRAINELEQSIAAAPSARAHYFINLARAAKTALYDLDGSAPELHLEAATTEEITNRTVKAVSGVASDDTYVASITVAEREVDMELAVRRRLFTEETALTEGANRIRVAATDLAGKTTEQYLDVYCDRRGPVIEIEEHSAREGRLCLRGGVSDDRGLLSLRINNRLWPITGLAPGYNFQVTLPDNVGTIAAADRAGNITRAVIREADTDPLLPPRDAPAATDAEGPAGSGSSTDQPLPGPLPAGDTEPPHIRITSPGPDGETYAETVALEGMISDASLLIHIGIDGRPVDNRKGTTIYFSQLKNLAPGMNIFHIVAADEHGNTAGRKIRMHRRIPAVRQIGARMAVAVLPFAHTGVAGDALRRSLNRSFSELGRFRMVTESKIDAALRALDLNTDRPVDGEPALLVGRQAEAGAVLTGSATATQEGMEIVGRLIDVETGTILAVNDVFVGDSGPVAPDIPAGRLAGKFMRDLPLAEGRVIAVSGSKVSIDAGTEANIRPAMELICYRESPPARHPVTGWSMTSEPQVLAILKVTDVERDRCRAVIVGPDPGLMVSDRIIAR